jgi:hypothetical protein
LRARSYQAKEQQVPALNPAEAAVKVARPPLAAPRPAVKGERPRRAAR